ncbi:hypothetical protein [Streptomyces sp. NBC_01465]|uniref:hypothetical protein n=1 Tax=Streptomyces sp. NBC_01465 TaxID=2903878 RepID=UPI002E32E033|nr:hypothetical protein [Streptomyces sp. NBC_01465]
MRRLGTVLGAAALALLTLPADAHAAGIACGGSTSTGRLALSGCISAQRGSLGPFPTRDISAYIQLHNTGPRAFNVNYEAYASADKGRSWTRVGMGRTLVAAHQTLGPIEVGSTTRVCAPHRVDIRVHAQVVGGPWSNWSSAATSQCQT